MSKTAYLFAGQGAQFVGMGRGLLEDAAARALFDQASEILGYDLAALCTEGPEDKLNTTAVSQPAIFTVSLAAVAARPNDKPDPTVTAGLSLGEYTALTHAGALTFEDGLRLVQRRGELMQQAADENPSTMVSILGMSAEAIEAICAEAGQGEVLKIANFLSPGNIVVSGTNPACERAAALADEQGAMKTIPLTVAGAFHTDLMKSGEAGLAEAIAAADVKDPAIPVVANHTGQYYKDAEDIRQGLVKQLTSSVMWEQSMKLLLDDGNEQMYEVGPGRVLTGLMRRTKRRHPCESLVDV